jgi:alpha-ketoglutarate-dependent taurine dioxygenase
MTDQMLDKLESNGWLELENISSDHELIRISRTLGQIVLQGSDELIYKLNPNNGEKGIKGTFSNRFGYGYFPLHTDTAFWTIPVRYILLSATRISSCNTILTSASCLLDQLSVNERKEAERAIFKIKTIHSQFYSSLLFTENNIMGIKYDPTCMTPVNNCAKKFVKKMEEIKPNLKEIKWSGNNAVIIDNWKALHGRGIASINETRELKRIYIN